MRAVVLSGPNQFAPAEIEKPQIGPDEILLEMKAAAICGTDMRILTGKKTKGVRYPSVIGHEFCGVIAEVGADVKGYEVGEKVAVANVIPCHHCSSCLRGRTNACLDRKAIGYEFDGGFEEYIRIPAICIENGNVVKLPELMSYQAGALIEPAVQDRRRPQGHRQRAQRAAPQGGPGAGRRPGGGSHQGGAARHRQP